MSKKHGSLFTGIGGFDLAAKWNDWENVFHCEKDESAKAKLKYHWSNSISYGDITETDFNVHRGKIDVLSGGFPCQDISHANPNATGITGTRSGLWTEYARAIWEIRPRAVVFENSPMLLVRGFEKVLSDLSGMGYRTEWRCIYASEFGFPHHRKRLYGISYAPGVRSESDFKKGGILHKSLYPAYKARGDKNETVNVPLSLKRFNAKSDFGSVQLYDGFSKELDKDSIQQYGNAIVPAIAYSIFYELNKIL